MQLRIFTLRFDPGLEGFDDAPVTAFLADKEVLGIGEHFFVKDDVPYLVLVVRYRMPALPPPTAQTERFAVNLDTIESDLAKLSPEQLREEVLPGVPFVYQTRWEDLDEMPTAGI